MSGRGVSAQNKADRTRYRRPVVAGTLIERRKRNHRMYPTLPGSRPAGKTYRCEEMLVSAAVGQMTFVN